MQKQLLLLFLAKGTLARLVKIVMTTSFVDKSSHKHLSLLVTSVFKVFDVSQFKGVQYAYSRFIMLIFL